MGNGIAKDIRAAPEDFSVLTLRFHVDEGVLSVLHAPNHVHKVIADTLTKHWTGGLANEARPHEIVRTYTLGKYKKKTFWNNAAAYAMFCALLDELSLIGWHLQTAPDLFLTLDDAELIFWHGQNKLTKADETVLMVRIKDRNSLQIVNGNEKEIKVIRNSVLKGMPITEEKKSKGTVNCLELVMEGQPWQPRNMEERIMATKSLLSMFGDLANLGQMLVAPVCLDGEQDVLFFNQAVKDPPANTKFAMLILHESDQLFMIGFPAEVIAIVKRGIKRDWEKGIENFNDTKHEGVATFDLANKPWHSSGTSRTEQLDVRHLMLGMFAELATAGWWLECGADLSQEVNDKSVFIFRSGREVHRQFAGIQPVGDNRMWLINLSTAAREAIHKILTFTMGEKGIVNQETISSDIEEYTLRGSPWRPKTTVDSLAARHVIATTVAALVARGWQVACVADLQDDYATVTSEKHVEDKSIRKKAKKEGGGRFGSMLKQQDINSKRAQKKMVSSHKEACDVHFVVFSRDE